MAAALIETRRGLRRLFATAVALVVAVAVGGTAYTLWRLRSQAVADGGRHAEIVARSVEDSLTHNLHMIERMVAGSLPFDPMNDPRRIDQMFGDSLRHMPLLRSISLLDDRGRVVISSNLANLGVTLPLRGFFPVTEANVEVIRIGPPLAGRDLSSIDPVAAERASPVPPDAIMHIPVLRSFKVGDRRLMLLAALNPEAVLNHMDHLLPASQGSLTIARHDGVILASSDPRQSPGTTDAALVKAMDGGRVEYGRLASGETVDDRLSAFRSSRLYPAVVVTRLDRRTALQAWQDESASIAGLLGPMLLLLVVVAFALYRRQLRILAEREDGARAMKLHATVFDSSLDAIIITNPAGDIVAVNPAFTEMSGYPLAEVIGRNPRLLASGRHDAEFYRSLWQALAERGFWRGEILNRRSDGSLYNARYAITAFRDSGGTLLHYIGIASDVTEQRLQEARIEDLNRDLARRAEDAEAASRAKTAFLANMSHELRTPLNHIVGFTSLLQRNPSSPKAPDWLGHVEHSAQHLLHLIETVLDVSRIESGRFELEPVDFTLQSLLDELEAAARHKAEAKHLALQAFYAADLPPRVHADRVQIAQVIGQLLDNAVKFTAQGTVSLRALVDPETAGGMRLLIEVEDQGIGIAAGQKDSLFTLFHQGDNSQTRQYGGTGIGLALCKRLADRMGGELEIRCSEGQGCLARLVLPVILPAGSPGGDTA